MTTTTPQTHRIAMLAAATALVLGAALVGFLAAPGDAAGLKATTACPSSTATMAS